MKLALVGWAADSGVGRELIDATWHLPVSCVYILPNPVKITRRDLIRVPAHYCRDTKSNQEMIQFLDQYKPDTILTWEVPGSWIYPNIWMAKGIRWIHMVHWDWFYLSRRIEWNKATILLAPNTMCQENLDKNNYRSILLPVPIDTERFKFKLREKANQFVSVYAYGGEHDRRSLGEIFKAWKGMEQPPSLTIFAQKNPPELESLGPTPGIEVLMGTAPDPWMLYDGMDVAIQPSRYEGVGVSMLEAQACGVPVLAVNAPPMNVIAPDLTADVRETVMVNIVGKQIPSSIPDPESIRMRVESIKGKDIRELSTAARKRVVERYSWSALKNNWLEVLDGR